MKNGQQSRSGKRGAKIYVIASGSTAVGDDEDGDEEVRKGECEPGSQR
jgi:hypothetical protein